MTTGSEQVAVLAGGFDQTCHNIYGIFIFVSYTNV